MLLMRVNISTKSISRERSGQSRKAKDVEVLKSGYAQEGPGYISALAVPYPLALVTGISTPPPHTRACPHMSTRMCTDAQMHVCTHTTTTLQRDAITIFTDTWEN